MANAIFPDYGVLLTQGYAENPQPAVLRSEMEGGLAKQARIRSFASHSRPLSYQFTLLEFRRFKNWFRNNTGRGADFFYWRDPFDDFTTKLARMVNGHYQANLVNGDALDWLVTFELETYE
jgi:hypothetical protein